MSTKRHPSKKHSSSRINHLFRVLEKMGFTVSRHKSGTFRLIPPAWIKGPVYMTHGTETAFFPILRDMRRMYMIEIDA